MILPADFQFSQSNLQDFIDCPYRFLLRYLKKIAWPALEAEPVLKHELAMQRGAQFHSLVQQYLVGIPVERLTPFAQEEELGRWWQAYLENVPKVLQGDRFPEITLSTSLQGRHLIAKYDLLLIQPAEKAIIYDWKTSNKKTDRQKLLNRMQTRVYPYLLAQAGAFLNQGKLFRPDQIEMIYWFTGVPLEPEKITYNLVNFKEDHQYLSSLVDEILQWKEEDFLKTQQEEYCRFCVYRSWCDRGNQAGRLSDEEENLQTNEPEELDFEQIAEIAF